MCASEFSGWVTRHRGGLVCPRCGAQERHRLLWLYLLRGRPELLRDARLLLHIAPEPGLRRRLEAIPHLRSVTTDLHDSGVAVRADVTALPWPDGTFDGLLCSHVLEHVEDDRTAMRELVRVLRPGGWAVVLSPLDLERASTLEDPRATTPEARRAAYWEADHVRLYGRDFPDRLREAGFQVEVDPWVRGLDPATIERYGLFPEDDVYLGRRPREPAR